MSDQVWYVLGVMSIPCLLLGAWVWQRYRAEQRRREELRRRRQEHYRAQRFVAREFKRRGL